MKLTLVDTSPALVAAWRHAFAELPEVSIRLGNILDEASNTLVSPANSYGLMDGGIDQAYLNFFGPEIQDSVLEIIARQPEGYLPVGAGILVATKHQRIPYLIMAPTMVFPGPVPPVNAYQAMSAALHTAQKHPRQIKHVYCPGLGTGTGCIDPEDAASEMVLAYQRWKERYP